MISKFKFFYRQLYLLKEILLYRIDKAEYIIYFGTSIGDTLLSSAVVKTLLEKNVRVLFFTPKPELFEHINLLRPGTHYYLSNVHHNKLFSALRENWRFSGRFKNLYYTQYLPEKDLDLQPAKHIITLMLEQVGILDVSIARPWVQVPEGRPEGLPSHKPIVAIQSSGMGAVFAMKNKEWFPDRFQKVVNALKENISFIQIGVITDPLLEGVVDKRGVPITETARILKYSNLFLGLVGMAMHLAKGVGCRSIIIYGGREAAWQSGYPEDIHIVNHPTCSPCWLRNHCNHERMCMSQIQPEIIIESIVMAMEGEMLKSVK